MSLSIKDIYPDTSSGGTLAITLQTYPNLLTNLNGYWNLNETTGTRNDYLGVSNFISNGLITGDHNGVVFDGTKRLRATNNTNLQFDASDYTIVFWVASTTPFHLNGMILSMDQVEQGDGSVRNWSVYGGNVGVNPFTSYVFDNTNIFITLVSANGLTPIPDNWIMVVIQHTLSTKNINTFIYGASGFASNPPNYGAGSSFTYSGTLTPFTTDLVLGGSIYQGYVGNMKQLGIWSRKLSFTELSYLFNNGEGLNSN
jgi:hypothetical protein